MRIWETVRDEDIEELFYKGCNLTGRGKEILTQEIKKRLPEGIIWIGNNFLIRDGCSEPEDVSISDIIASAWEDGLLLSDEDTGVECS